MKNLFLDFKLILAPIQNFKEELETEDILVLKPTLVLEGGEFVSCNDTVGMTLLCSALTFQKTTHLDYLDLIVISQKSLIPVTGIIPVFQKSKDIGLVPILRVENYMTGDQLSANQIAGLGIPKLSPSISTLEGKNGIVLQTFCGSLPLPNDSKKHNLN